MICVDATGILVWKYSCLLMLLCFSVCKLRRGPFSDLRSPPCIQKTSHWAVFWPEIFYILLLFFFLFTVVSAASRSAACEGFIFKYFDVQVSLILLPQETSLLRISHCEYQIHLQTTWNWSFVLCSCFFLKKITIKNRNIFYPHIKPNGVQLVLYKQPKTCTCLLRAVTSNKLENSNCKPQQ